MKKKSHPAGIRNKSTVTLKDAMSAMLKSYNIDVKFDEASLVSTWEKIMGKAIANRTSNIYIRDHVMIVTLSSAPLKHELNNSKSKVMALIEQHYGKPVVKDILFI
ncbi:DUF721 domain-containing protein [Reichenbachiella sp. MALMAid0571]|uniref:DUF721 domain-containing protein n=1 Tax=Reichenbachiella sp. MALMAid0571 TaxID=3143939 RepID=UPI0032DF426F